MSSEDQAESLRAPKFWHCFAAQLTIGLGDRRGNAQDIRVAVRAEREILLVDDGPQLGRQVEEAGEDFVIIEDLDEAPPERVFSNAFLKMASKSTRTHLEAFVGMSNLLLRAKDMRSSR